MLAPTSQPRTITHSRWRPWRESLLLGLAVIGLIIVGAIFLYFVTAGLLWLEGYASNTAPSSAHSRSSIAHPDPLRLSDSALEQIPWDALKGWSADDHAAAFATFAASCRPLLRTGPRDGDKQPMYAALVQLCRQALAAGRVTDDQARLFFERTFVLCT